MLWTGKQLWVLVLGAAMLVACNDPGAGPDPVTAGERYKTPGTVLPGAGSGGGGNASPESVSPGQVSDPSVCKCEADGFVVEQVLENGVVVRHRCVDPRTGISCDTWAYFRGACSLTRSGASSTDQRSGEPARDRDRSGTLHLP